MGCSINVCIVCIYLQVSVETLTEIGDPKSAICDVIQKYNINLLVMGERGLGKIKRYVGYIYSSDFYNTKLHIYAYLVYD